MSRLLFGTVFVILGTVSSTLEAQVSRHDQLMQDHRNRVNAMRERSRARMESMMSSDPVERHRNFMQESQARLEAHRKEFESRTKQMTEDPDAYFQSQMDEADAGMEEHRKRTDELIRSAKQEQEQDDRSSGRRYRIRGRSIRGILVLFGLIAAGFWKLVGGGSSNE